MDEEIQEHRLEHEECLNEASECQRLALEAAEDDDREEAAYMKKESIHYMSGAEASVKRMIKMQNLR